MSVDRPVRGCLYAGLLGFLSSFTKEMHHGSASRSDGTGPHTQRPQSGYREEDASSILEYTALAHTKRHTNFPEMLPSGSRSGKGESLDNAPSPMKTAEKRQILRHRALAPVLTRNGRSSKQKTASPRRTLFELSGRAFWQASGSSWQEKRPFFGPRSPSTGAGAIGSKKEQ